MFIYVHFYIYECMINLTKNKTKKKPTNDNEITLKYSKNSITNQKYWQIIENDAFNDLKNSRMITIIMKYQKKTRTHYAVIRKLFNTIQGIATPTEPFKKRAATAATANLRHRKLSYLCRLRSTSRIDWFQER